MQLTRLSAIQCRLVITHKQHVHGLHSSSSSRSQLVVKSKMLSDDFSISQLAIPAVSVLISFLAYTSQYFFLRFEDAPLQKDEVWKINIFALCIWICYYRACYVDPGRLPSDRKSANPDKQEEETASGRQRWCRRCEAYKPLRAHHCKTCQRLHNLTRTCLSQHLHGMY